LQHEVEYLQEFIPLEAEEQEEDPEKIKGMSDVEDN
jgi:hypothetical protein